MADALVLLVVAAVAVAAVEAVPQRDAGYDYVAAAGALGEVHTELRWAALSDFDGA